MLMRPIEAESARCCLALPNDSVLIKMRRCFRVQTVMERWTCPRRASLTDISTCYVTCGFTSKMVYTISHRGDQPRDRVLFPIPRRMNEDFARPRGYRTVTRRLDFLRSLPMDSRHADFKGTFLFLVRSCASRSLDTTIDSGLD